MPTTAAHLTGPDQGKPLSRTAPSYLTGKRERVEWRRFHDRLDHRYIGTADEMALADLVRLHILVSDRKASQTDARAYREYLHAFGLTPKGRKALLRNSGLKVEASQSKFAKLAQG